MAFKEKEVECKQEIHEEKPASGFRAEKQDPPQSEARDDTVSIQESVLPCLWSSDRIHPQLLPLRTPPVPIHYDPF